MSSPNTWQHGDIPEGDVVPPDPDMQQYSDELNMLRAAIGDEKINLPVRYLENYSGPSMPTAVLVEYRFVHRARYLHFVGEGKIVEPNPNTCAECEDVRISAESGQVGVIDLDTVEWLAYGMEYRVQRVDAALEDDDP